MAKKILVVLIGLWCALPVAAQEVTRQQSLWGRLYLQGKISPKWSWHWELDERLLVPAEQLQFISHAHLHRKLGPQTELSLGASYSTVSGTPEPRLFQELHWGIPVGKRWKLAQRYRTEQRFFHPAAGEWDIRLRARYRIQATFQASRHFSVKASDELLWQNTGFDQNRIYGAAEYRFSPVFALEMGYLNLYQRRKVGQYYNPHILRVTNYITFP